jgi:queuosine precursor transporter
MTATAETPLRDLKSFKYFELLLSTFLVILLISNLVGGKLCQFGPFSLFGLQIKPFILGGAQLLFPLTYIYGDVFTEVYGYAASRRAIWMGFFASFLISVMGLIMVALPPAPEWHDQDAYVKIFGFVPRMVVASLIAYWCGEFANSFTLARMKLMTRGKHLWTRTVGSTVVGQAVDTAVFLTLAFGSKLEAGTIVSLIINSYLFKVIYEVLATPLTYWVVNSLKRAEGVDTFDFDTNFSPFKKIFQS